MPTFLLSGELNSNPIRRCKMDMYDAHFEQLCVQSGIHFERFTKQSTPNNLTSIREILQPVHHSLTAEELSRKDDMDFGAFWRVHHDSDHGDKMMANLYPLLVGDSGGDVLVEKNCGMRNLCKFHPALPVAQPHVCDGARQCDISRRVREDLGDFIVPMLEGDGPAAPNHFVQFAGQWDCYPRMHRQAVYNGAFGARAMFALQNYGRDEPLYDGNAYALTCTYFPSSTFAIYTVHPVRSASGRTEFQLTRVKTVSVGSNDASFNDVSSALRNARDFCEQQRNCLIGTAKAVADSMASDTVPAQAPAWLHAMRIQGQTEDLPPPASLGNES